MGRNNKCYNNRTGSSMVHQQRCCWTSVEKRSDVEVITTRTSFTKDLSVDSKGLSRGFPPPPFVANSEDMFQKSEVDRSDDVKLCFSVLSIYIFGHSHKMVVSVILNVMGMMLVKFLDSG